MNMPVPQAILDAPTLPLGLELYLTAWLELNSCRPIGMTAGPIPWTAVHMYANFLDLDDDQREDLHDHISSMDNVYFKYLDSKKKKESHGKPK